MNTIKQLTTNEDIKNWFVNNPNKLYDSNGNVSNDKTGESYSKLDLSNYDFYVYENKAWICIKNGKLIAPIWIINENDRHKQN